VTRTSRPSGSGVRGAPPYSKQLAAKRIKISAPYGRKRARHATRFRLPHESTTPLVTTCTSAFDTRSVDRH
jgi:hypothetical protein